MKSARLALIVTAVGCFVAGVSTMAAAAESSSALPSSAAMHREIETWSKRFQSATDPREAQRVFDEIRAASEKSPQAAYLCGMLAAQPGSVVADRAIAFECLERAARRGVSEAQHRLGLMLIDAKGDPARRAEAERWLTAAARTLPESVYALALLKADQQPNAEAARRAVVEKAAEAGYAPAQYALAREHHAIGTPDGRSTARALLESAAAQKHAEAAVELALLIQSDNREQDIPRIVQLLEVASAAGSPRADYALGTRLMEAKGVKRDTERAFALFRRAAAHGDVNAMYATGYALGQGIGTGADDAAAVEWFRRAADRGDANAMFALGNSYANGWGVGKSLDLAYKWYCRAAQKGSVAGLEMIRHTRMSDCPVARPEVPGRSTGLETR